MVATLPRSKTAQDTGGRRIAMLPPASPVPAPVEGYQDWLATLRGNASQTPAQSDGVDLTLLEDDHVKDHSVSTDQPINRSTDQPINRSTGHGHLATSRLAGKAIARIMQRALRAGLGDLDSPTQPARGIRKIGCCAPISERAIRKQKPQEPADGRRCIREGSLFGDNTTDCLS